MSSLLSWMSGEPAVASKPKASGPRVRRASRLPDTAGQSSSAVPGVRSAKPSESAAQSLASHPSMTLRTVSVEEYDIARQHGMRFVSYGMLVPSLEASMLLVAAASASLHPTGSYRELETSLEAKEAWRKTDLGGSASLAAQAGGTSTVPLRSKAAAAASAIDEPPPATPPRSPAVAGSMKWMKRSGGKKGAGSAVAAAEGVLWMMLTGLARLAAHRASAQPAAREHTSSGDGGTGGVAETRTSSYSDASVGSEKSGGSLAGAGHAGAGAGGGSGLLGQGDGSHGRRVALWSVLDCGYAARCRSASGASPLEGPLDAVRSEAVQSSRDFPVAAAAASGATGRSEQSTAAGSDKSASAPHPYDPISGVVDELGSGDADTALPPSAGLILAAVSSYARRLAVWGAHTYHMCEESGGSLYLGVTLLLSPSVSHSVAFAAGLLRVSRRCMRVSMAKSLGSVARQSLRASAVAGARVPWLSRGADAGATVGCAARQEESTLDDIEWAARVMCGPSDAVALLETPGWQDSNVEASFQEPAIVDLMVRAALDYSDLPSAETKAKGGGTYDPSALWKYQASRATSAAGRASSRKRRVAQAKQAFEPREHLAVSAAAASKLVAFLLASSGEKARPKRQRVVSIVGEGEARSESSEAVRLMCSQVPKWMQSIELPEPGYLLQQSLTAATARDSCRVDDESDKMQGGSLGRALGASIIPDCAPWPPPRRQTHRDSVAGHSPLDWALHCSPLLPPGVLAARPPRAPALGTEAAPQESSRSQAAVLAPQSRQMMSTAWAAGLWMQCLAQYRANAAEGGPPAEDMGRPIPDDIDAAIDLLLAGGWPNRGGLPTRVQLRIGAEQADSLSVSGGQSGGHQSEEVGQAEVGSVQSDADRRKSHELDRSAFWNALMESADVDAVSPDAHLAFSLALCGRWPRSTTVPPLGLYSHVEQLMSTAGTVGGWMAPIHAIAGVGVPTSLGADLRGPSPSCGPLCLASPSMLSAFPSAAPSAAVIGSGESGAGGESGQLSGVLQYLLGSSNGPSGDHDQAAADAGDDQARDESASGASTDGRGAGKSASQSHAHGRQVLANSTLMRLALAPILPPMVLRTARNLSIATSLAESVLRGTDGQSMHMRLARALASQASPFGPQVRSNIAAVPILIWYLLGAAAREPSLGSGASSHGGDRTNVKSDAANGSFEAAAATTSADAASPGEVGDRPTVEILEGSSDGSDEDSDDDIDASKPPACVLWASVGPVPALPLARPVATACRPKLSRAGYRSLERCSVGESHPLGLRPAVLVSSDGADGNSGGATTLLRVIGSAESSGGAEFPAGLERALIPLGVVVPPPRRVQVAGEGGPTVPVPNTITITLYHCWQEPPAKAEVLRGGDEPGSLHRRGYDVGHGLRGDEYDELGADDEEVVLKPPLRHEIESGAVPDSEVPADAREARSGGGGHARDSAHMHLQRGQQSRARVLSFDFVPEAILSGACSGSTSTRDPNDPSAVLVTFTGASLGIHPADDRFPPDFRLTIAVSRVPLAKWAKRLAMFGGVERAAAAQCLDPTSMRMMASPGLAASAACLARAWAGTAAIPDMSSFGNSVMIACSGGKGLDRSVSMLQVAIVRWELDLDHSRQLPSGFAESAVEAASAGIAHLRNILSVLQSVERVVDDCKRTVSSALDALQQQREAAGAVLSSLDPQSLRLPSATCAGACLVACPDPDCSAMTEILEQHLCNFQSTDEDSDSHQNKGPSSLSSRLQASSRDKTKRGCAGDGIDTHSKVQLGIESIEKAFGIASHSLAVPSTVHGDDSREALAVQRDSICVKGGVTATVKVYPPAMPVPDEEAWSSTVKADLLHKAGQGRAMGAGQVADMALSSCRPPANRADAVASIALNSEFGGAGDASTNGLAHVWVAGRLGTSSRGAQGMCQSCHACGARIPLDAPAIGLASGTTHPADVTGYLASAQKLAVDTPSHCNNKGWQLKGGWDVSGAGRWWWEHAGHLEVPAGDEEDLCYKQALGSSAAMSTVSHAISTSVGCPEWPVGGLRAALAAHLPVDARGCDASSATDILCALGVDMDTIMRPWRRGSASGEDDGLDGTLRAAPGSDEMDVEAEDAWHPLAGNAEDSAASGAGVSMLVRARAQRRQREDYVVDNLKQSFFRVPRGLIRRVLRQMARSGGSLEMVAQAVSVIESRRPRDKPKKKSHGSHRRSVGIRTVAEGRPAARASAERIKDDPASPQVEEASGAAESEQQSEAELKAKQQEDEDAAFAAALQAQIDEEDGVDSQRLMQRIGDRCTRDTAARRQAMREENGYGAEVEASALATHAPRRSGFRTRAEREGSGQEAGTGSGSGAGGATADPKGESEGGEGVNDSESNGVDAGGFGGLEEGAQGAGLLQALVHSSSLTGTVFQHSYSNGAEPGVVDALPLWRRPCRSKGGRLRYQAHPLDQDYTTAEGSKSESLAADPSKAQGTAQPPPVGESCDSHGHSQGVPPGIEDESDDEDEDGPSCAVCMEAYLPNHVCRSLPCGHNLHSRCVDPWLLMKGSCPVCNMQLPSHLGELARNGARRGWGILLPSSEAGAIMPEIADAVSKSSEGKEQEPLKAWGSGHWTWVRAGLYARSNGAAHVASVSEIPDGPASGAGSGSAGGRGSRDKQPAPLNFKQLPSETQQNLKRWWAEGTGDEHDYSEAEAQAADATVRAILNGTL